MKLLALLLIMLNITFFLWQYHSGTISLERDVLINSADTREQIILVSELNDSPSLKQAQSGLSWCAAGTAIEQSIRSAIFVSDYSLAPSSGVRSSLLLAEWLDMHFVSHQISQTRPKKSPPILAFNDASIALTKATPTPPKTSISDETNRRAKQELGGTDIDAANAPIVKKQEMAPKKTRLSPVCVMRPGRSIRCSNFTAGENRRASIPLRSNRCAEKSKRLAITWCTCRPVKLMNNHWKMLNF